MRTLALVLGSCLTLSLAGCSDRPQMRVEPNPVVADTTVWARFDRPIRGQAVDQYWIVIAPAGAPAAYQENRLHVARSAEGVQMQAPHVPGDYEVRLHGDWPKREHNVVRTVPLHVLPADVVGTR
jgi:hypothetical protein